MRTIGLINKGPGTDVRFIQKYKNNAFLLLLALLLFSSQYTYGNVINYENFGTTAGTIPSGGAQVWSVSGSSWTCVTTSASSSYTVPTSLNAASGGCNMSITMNGSNTDLLKTSNIDCSNYLSGSLYFGYRFNSSSFTKSIVVELSRDGGSTWTTLSTISNPGNTTWNLKSITLPTGSSGGSIDASSQVQIRFSSSGSGSGGSFTFQVDDIELDGFTSITPFALSGGDYYFKTWASGSTTGTYPGNMVFHQASVQDPSLTAYYSNNYNAAYNLSSGTRISGQGSGGFTFINTSTNGFVGQAVLALNTSGRNNVAVSWDVNVQTAGSRPYNLRLQYQVGSLSGSWTDASTDSTKIKFTYVVGTTGTGVSYYSPVTLPGACQNQSSTVYLRWVYYYAGGGSSTRPEMGIDEIAVTSATLTEVILPQYMEGISGTNSSRVPYVCRLTLSGLSTSKTYRYNTQVVLSTDEGTVTGAGNPIYIPSSGSFVRATTVDLTTSGNYGTFTTDGSGNYTGWFAIEPTGSAKFAQGNNAFLRIELNDGNSGTTQNWQLTTSSSIKVLSFTANSTSSDGSGIYGTSSGSAKDFVMLYDNTAGSGRPLAGAYIESDGISQSTNYVSFYGTSVDASSGAWGAIVPNVNSNGIQRIESRTLSGGAIGCYYTASSGIWPSGTNTVNYKGGTTAETISSTDAPLSCSPPYKVTLSSSSSSVVSTASGSEAAATVVTIYATSSYPVSSSETVNLSVSGTGITSGDYTLSNATITIAAGQTQGSVTFTVVDDAIAEGTEVASVSISSTSSNLTTTGSSNTAVAITISDNDVPHINLSFSAGSSVTTASSSEATPANTVTVYATSNIAVFGDQTITLSVSGTGITSGDYSMSGSGIITILNGQTQGSLTFTVTDDAIVEATETANIGIASTSSGLTTSGSSVTSIAVSITDNDIAPIVNIYIGSSGTSTSVTSWEATPANTVTIRAVTSSNVSVDETVTLGSVTGTGITSGDYSLSSTTITIPAGSNTGSVTFTVTDDATSESTETASVSISSTSGGITSIGNANSSVSISIVDNEDRIIIGSGSSYFQNFNSMASSGTSSTLPSGWYLSETGGDATYSADDGSTSSGNTYSYGSSGSSDRALGTVCSGTVTQDAIGAKVMNLTGTTLNHIYMSFKVEQWRAGGSRTFSDYLNFQYSTNATSLSDASATWIDANGLDITSVLSTSATAGAYNGNTGGNYKKVAGSITNLNLANNAIMWIRWVDVNVSGADDGLAIDDIYISQPKNVWYDKGSGDLSSASSWTDDINGGSGSSATPNFADTAQVYIVKNQSSAVIGGGAVGPDASAVMVLGDGSASPTLSINSNSSWAANISVSNGATIDMKSSTLPTLHEIKTGSTVYYDNPGTTVVLPILPYTNLKFNNVTMDASPVTLNGATLLDVSLSGDLSVVNTTFTTKWRNTVNLLTNGNGSQTISGGNTATSLSMYSLNSTKSAGGISLASNANLDIKETLTIVYTGAAVFSDGGNTMTIGDDLNLDGSSASNYNLTGTVIMTSEGGIANGTNCNVRNSNSGNSYIVAKLNNLTIDQTGQTGTADVQFSGGAGTTGTVYINGTLYIKNTLTGNKVTFSSNSAVPTINVTDFKMDGGSLDFGTTTPTTGNYTSILNVGGNFTKTGGTITTSKSGFSGKVLFSKAGTQTFSNDASNSLDKVSFIINPGSTLQLNSNLPLYSTSSLHRSITVNGTLDAGSNAILESTSASNDNSSQFILNGALKSSAANGIGDNIKTSGTTTLADTANYELYGSSTIAKAGFNTIGKTKARNITISNTSTGGVTMDGNDFDITTTGTLTVNSGSYLSLPNLNNFKKASSSNASVVINGTVEIKDVHGFNDANTAAFQGYDTAHDFSMGSNSLIIYNGTGSQTITPANYANLKITGARSSGSTITFATAGIIGVAGDFSCDASGTGLSYAYTGSIFNINGSGAQNLPAFALNVNDLMLSKGNVKTLNADMTINGTLNLISGFIKLDNNNLTLSNNAVVSGGSANSYVRISGAGSLKREANSSGVFYPIGYNPFLPVTITLESGATATNFSVGVTDGVTDQNNALVTSDVIGKTWTIVPEGSGTLNNVTVTLQWDNTNAGDELTGFNSSNCYMAYRTSLTDQWTRINNLGQIATLGTVANSSKINSDPMTFVGGNTYYFGIGSDVSPLPVKYVKFNAVGKEADVVLNWATSFEVNNAGFEVQRSHEGNSWQSAGFIQGHGNSNTLLDYTFTDAMAFKTLNTDLLYYRLRQVDFNGKSEYSELRSVSYNAKAGVAQISPNPVEGIATMSVFSKFDNETLELNILDEAGRLLVKQKALMTKGNNNILLDTDKLKRGMYLLEVKTDEQFQYVKFYKN